jgi:hypothetical protein
MASERRATSVEQAAVPNVYDETRDQPKNGQSASKLRVVLGSAKVVTVAARSDNPGQLEFCDHLAVTERGHPDRQRDL